MRMRFLVYWRRNKKKTIGKESRWRINKKLWKIDDYRCQTSTVYRESSSLRLNRLLWDECDEKKRWKKKNEKACNSGRWMDDKDENVVSDSSWLLFCVLLLLSAGWWEVEWEKLPQYDNFRGDILTVMSFDESIRVLCFLSVDLLVFISYALLWMWCIATLEMNLNVEI